MLTGSFDPLAFMLLCFVQWCVKNTWRKERETEIILSHWAVCCGMSWAGKRVPALLLMDGEGAKTIAGPVKKTIWAVVGLYYLFILWEFVISAGLLLAEAGLYLGRHSSQQLWVRMALASWCCAAVEENRLYRSAWSELGVTHEHVRSNPKRCCWSSLWT